MDLENMRPCENSSEQSAVADSKSCFESTSSGKNCTEMSENLKRERRRERIIQEIINTENTYQKHLELVVKFVEEPLRLLKLVPGHVIVTIFSNIKQIININKELCQHLKVHPIGKAFLMIGPFLKLYSTYANNHERALATLMEWDQKSPEFSSFRRKQEELEEFGGLKLNALLITPVQRVPRYKLLLEDLLENTDSAHEDYNSLKEACCQITAVAQHINEHIKQQDNFMKMLAVQKSLVGPLAPKILAPGRMFIKDGRLKKVSRKGGRSHERMFFLFSDILMYAKPKLLESGSYHSYNCCCIYPLHHCTVNRVFGHSQGHGALFTIACKGESLLLYSDQKVVDQWIEALNQAIGRFVENRQSLRKESSAKVPIRRGALAKYRRQQEQADPLAKKSTISSLFNNHHNNGSNKNNNRNSTTKTTGGTGQKGFLKRTLKETTSHCGCVNGASSSGVDPSSSGVAPSPKKKPGVQETSTFMKSLWCLTPKGGRRKKCQEEEEEFGEVEAVTSTPAAGAPTRGSGDFISLEHSGVWRGGDESSYMEYNSQIVAIGRLLPIAEKDLG